MHQSRPRRLLITGSRTWSDRTVIHDALRDAWVRLGSRPDTILISGTARGADTICEEVWRAQGLPVERHPAHWDVYGKSAGYRRNQEMVDSGADLCLAFILQGSRGAVMCANLAEKASIPVIRFEK